MSNADSWERRLASARDRHRRGELDAAAHAYTQLLADRPDAADALELNAILLGQRGEFAAAAALFDRALRSDPRAPRIHSNHGAMLLDAGRPSDAVAAFRRAIELDPTSAVARRGLGRALLASGDASTAIPFLEADAREHPPGTAPWGLLASAWFNLGLLRSGARDFDGALQAFDRALDIEPAALDVLRAKAAALRSSGRVSSAANVYRQCAELAPADPSSWSDLGHVLHELGSLDLARDAYRSAVTLDPLAAGAWLGLAEVHRFERGDELTERLFAAAARTDVAMEVRTPILFAAAQAHDTLGQVDESFACLSSANALRRKTFEYDVARDELRIAELTQRFTRDLLDRLTLATSESARPIFIVGMPRSGSTLVEHILASHPAVAAAGELPAFQSLVLQRLPHYPHGLNDLSPDDVASLADGYLRALDAATTRSPHASDGSPHASRVPLRATDKFLPNFLYVGLIHACLPNASVIWCLRDAVDTCFSCYRKSFVGHQAFAYDLRELGRYYRAHLAALSHWQTLLGERLHVVQYEALVREPRAVVEALLRHCDLDWHDDCLRAHENERAVQTASAAQVRRPIYASSVGYAQRYRRHLEPLLEALGNEMPTAARESGRQGRT